jgi:hypothetical protein
MTDDQLLDFDSIDDWFPLLTSVLDPLLPPDISRHLARQAPEFIEDARDLVFQCADRNEITEAIIHWLQSSQLLAYHGTRLTDEEAQNVLTQGLKPLTVEDRRNRIVRSLSTHSKWSDIAGRLDTVLRAYGSGNVGGTREGDVHLTVSRFGLTSSFNHYLTHGAEVDQHIAYDLLGDEGKNRLRHDGKPRIVVVSVPGEIAVKAANRYFDFEELRARQSTPNLVIDFLKSWSYRLAHPDFQSRCLELDSGLIFDRSIPAEWICRIDTLSDKELKTKGRRS